jgi:lysine 2,3-aminomutase
MQSQKKSNDKQVLNYTLEEYLSDEEVPPGCNTLQWQFENSLTSLVELRKYIDINVPDPIASKFMQFRVTPYYLKLAIKNPVLKKAIIPVDKFHSYGVIDPLNEEGSSPVKGLVHRYPDRVLLTITDFCYTNCQFCTRSRLINREYISPNDIDNAIVYIQKHKEIRDVIISGGDPLTKPTIRIVDILEKLRAINHVEIIRIGTKVPVVLPFRINELVVEQLKKFHPLYINIHFTHPAELTPECCKALKLLADAGIPLGSQTVLLKGINDSSEIIKELFHKLLMNRVKPYYLYACDSVIGNEIFKTDLKKGIEIMESLRGHTSGLAVPYFVIDAPGGGGKIPILPNYVEHVYDDKVLLRNYKNKVYSYSW